MSFKKFFSLFLVLICVLIPGYSIAKTRIVIVSATYGAGHNSAAQSIQNLVREQHSDEEVGIKILKLEDYVIGGFGPLTSKGFDWVYQYTPWAYETIWQAVVGTAEHRESAGEIPQPIFDKEKFYEALKAESPDLIVTTHHISAHLLISLRETGRISHRVKFAWLDTDWVVGKKFFDLISKGVDMTFIAHPELHRVRQELGIPLERMRVTGPPLNPAVFSSFSEDDRIEFLENFLQAPDHTKSGFEDQQTFVNGVIKKQGTHFYRLDPSVTTVTLTSGRAGIGDYTRIFKGLVHVARERKIPLQVIAVCAANEKNFKSLSRYYRDELAAGRMNGITLVATGLMDPAKVIRSVRSSVASIGKSGVQTPFEAIMMGVINVSGKYIGGQERVAAEAYDRLNLALTFEKKEEEQVGQKLFDLLSDPVRMKKMRDAQDFARENYRPDLIQKYFSDEISRVESEGHPEFAPQGVEPPTLGIQALNKRLCSILSRKN
jgi:UDP-N-acetylglucosamine:LPS N-acetylglucosamine transferase